MNQALSSDLRKADVRRAETPADAITYTIKVLSSAPAANGHEVRTVLFSRTSQGETIEISAETDAHNLLAKLPDFLDAAMEIQRSLWPAQRTISQLRSSHFPRLAEESRLLRWLAEGSPSAERAELARRRVTREAMIVRDVAWEAIRGVLPPDRRREVDALVGLHETEVDLAVSMDAIAALIDGMLGDPEDALILTACDIDGAYAAALRRHASVLRAAEAEAAPSEPAPKRPRVLRLIGMAYRALRTDAFLTVARASEPPRAVAR
ncbi:Hypothetical protein A7982_01966 [Minicystis rosea]|nr:Hypothetical protein A7982_01966 [Minicystis rosea]